MSEATSDIKSPAELSSEARQALRDLILSLADSKRIMGIHYAEWVLGAPELEASIAASSISQDEWGHSRLLYALLKDFGDDPERLEHGREARDYCNVEALDQRLETWPDFVVVNAIVDTAITVQLESLAETCYAPLRQRVQKQLEEERFHSAHGAAWLRRLGGMGDAARAAIQKALDARWSAVLHWFGPDEHGAKAKTEGLWDRTGAELRSRLLDRVTPLIKSSGLALPTQKLDFADWNASTHRSSHSGPAEETVARARGDRNRAFLLD